MFVGALSENVPWQQGKVNLSNFCFKTSPIYFKKVTKLKKKSFDVLELCSKTSRKGGGGGGED